ncbi:3-deoxy-D-manno-octulosonate cytidylyltransferase [Candidatus Magnetoovum chiemensis]|nr:3-deoxy-D-manno-octulosonate cytidylyltransferase [Candidatus Magnetoovum chiemensis]
MKSAVIIPARYESSRFRGKAVAKINGKPMIQHVYEGASQSRLANKIIIATDDKRIYDVAKQFCSDLFMTKKEHTCGTDRIAEVSKELDYDIIVNVQCDEPMIKGDMIDDTINLLYDEKAQIGTLKKRIKKHEDIFNANVVKTVTDKEGFALYFSRSPIPYYRDTFSLQKVSDISALNLYKHIGIYSYRKETLIRLSESESCDIENAEKLEQLRALYMGIKIKIKETEYDVYGVDTYEDLKKVEQWLNIYS